MNKGDAPTAGADPRYLVNQLVAGRATIGECGIEVGNAIADVVDAGAAAGQEPGDGAIGVSRREQFHGRATEGQGDDGRAVSDLRLVGRHVQDVTIECQRGVEIGNGDTDMGDVRGTGLGHAGLRSKTINLPISLSINLSARSGFPNGE